MSQFKIFGQAVQARFNEMVQHELFIVAAPDIWDRYLASFPPGTNPIFRERTEHDCSCCKNFIHNLGPVVTIKNGRVESVWDKLGTLPHPYDHVAKELAAYIKEAPIIGLFRTKEAKYGQATSRELLKGGEVQTWHHFAGSIANRHRTQSPAAILGKYANDVGVFQRGLKEITMEALNTVSELIAQNSLYRGEQFKRQVGAFYKLKKDHEGLGLATEQNLFIWSNANKPGALLRNTVIGTLLLDLSTGVDLETAVRAYEKKVAPINYKRPTALITSRMIDSALATLRELGLENAVERRFARLSDVSVNDVLFVDNSIQGQMRDGLAGLLMEAVKPRRTSADLAEDISVNDFFDTIVPQAESISLLLENGHLNNLVSLTAPVHQDVRPLFKWANNFAWSYDGNVTDSIKSRVKRAGGNVDADLRVSLGWHNTDDLDLHCHDTLGRHICFGKKHGILDVDMNVTNPVRHAVENMQFNRGQLHTGNYTFCVDNYTKRESIDVGFVLEVEYDGQTQQYTFDRAVNQKVQCLDIQVREGRVVGIKILNDLLHGGSAPVEKWGLVTQRLVPVDTLLLSPNHWNGQAIGNRHWFFILRDCINPGQPRGIYNEFLIPELEKHRKVFEILGSKMRCSPSNEQLSGVGFSSTNRNTAKVVVTGPRINKMLNIQF